MMHTALITLALAAILAPAALTAQIAPTRSQVIAGDGNVIAFEAENFISQTGYVRVRRSDASGGAGMRADGPTGSKLNFRITVSRTGLWYVWIRTYATGHLNNGMFLQLNNQPVRAPAGHPQAGATAIYLSKNGWSWQPEWLLNHRHTGPVTMNITAGTHVLSVVKRLIENPVIDKIVLTRSSTPPSGFGPAVSVAVATPSNVRATRDWTRQVRLTWGAVSGATSYEVWRRASNAARATRIATPATTSFSDSSAAVGVTYYYWVRARKSAVVGGFSNRVTGRRSSILLSNGQAYGAIGGAQGSLRYFRIYVPAGRTRLVVRTWGGSGDADLYVRYNGLPSTTRYNGRSTSVSNVDRVAINNPAAGYWYILVRGDRAYSGAIIQANN